jgi:hypothetical protein
LLARCRHDAVGTPASLDKSFLAQVDILSGKTCSRASSLSECETTLLMPIGTLIAIGNR